MNEKTKKKQLVIIESPYAGDVEKNVEYARACMRDSIYRGEAPFASHLLYTQVLDDNIKEERNLGIELGHLWAESTDAIFAFYIDHGLSEGMALSLELNQRLGRRCEVRNIETVTHIEPE